MRFHCLFTPGRESIYKRLISVKGKQCKHVGKRKCRWPSNKLASMLALIFINIGIVGGKKMVQYVQRICILALKLLLIRMRILCPFYARTT